MATRRKVATAEATARSRVKAIQEALTTMVDAAGRVAKLARESFDARDWEELGYESWAALCSAEFQIYTEHLSRELIAEINSELILGARLSDRAAAVVTGTDHKTAKADAIKSGGEDSPPETSRGADGKEYQRTRSSSSGQRGSEITLELTKPHASSVKTIKESLANLAEHPKLSEAQRDDLVKFLTRVTTKLKKRTF